MKVLILLAIIGFVAVQVSEARMNAFSCSGECYPYSAGPFCMENGTVVCNNCVRDRINCAGVDTATCTSSQSSSDCPAWAQID